MERYNQTFKCTCERGDVVLRTSRKPYSYGKQYYACPYSKIYTGISESRCCSNCKFLAEKIKTLEAKIKILEGALEMERHPEKHTLDSAAILHELYNEMGKLSME
ncbi:hypothetical protein Tco_0662759 [Tanacetum coccineum]